MTGVIFGSVQIRLREIELSLQTGFGSGLVVFGRLFVMIGAEGAIAPATGFSGRPAKG